MPEFSPIKVLDFELSSPFTSVAGLVGYCSVQALVRVFGRPVGYLKIPVQGGRCSRGAVVKAALEKYGPAILSQFLYRGVERLPLPSPLKIQDLFSMPNPSLNGTVMPMITVAVCSRDNTEDLARCLGSVLLLDYPELDILVIDNAPRTDSTERMVESKFPEIRYVREPRPGLDWARNRAIREARGEILAFTDDDVVVDEGWARALAGIFSEDPDVMAVTGLVVPYELETEAQVLFEKFGGFGRGFTRRWYKPGTRRGIAFPFGNSGRYGTGANMAFRRSVFDIVGDFDPALGAGTVSKGGDDLEMFFRVLKEGFALVYEPAAIVRHGHRRDFSQLHAQIRDWGVALLPYMMSVVRSYPDELTSLLRLGLWRVGLKMRTIFLSIFHPSKSLFLLHIAELQGILAGLSLYRKARRNAAHIMRNFGPLPLPEIQDKRSQDVMESSECKSDGNTVEDLTLELTCPLKGIDNVAHSRARVLVTWKDIPVGFMEVDALDGRVSVPRIRQEIVGQLGVRLLDPEFTLDLDSLWTEAYGAMVRHFQPDHSVPFRSERLPEHIPVSVIITGGGAPEDLRNCLDSLKQQETKRTLEIVVIDTDCAPVPEEIIEMFPFIIRVRAEGEGLSAARNYGIRASGGDVIVLIARRSVMNFDWLEKLLAPFVRSEVMGVTGKILHEGDALEEFLSVKYPDLRMGFEPIEADRNWFESRIRSCPPIRRLGTAVNAAFRSAVFSCPEIGLFDEALGAGAFTASFESSEFFYRMLKAGYRIVYEPAAYIRHTGDDTRDIHRRIYDFGKGYVAYQLTNLLRHHDLRTLISLLLEQPLSHLSMLKARLLGKCAYPLSNSFAEVAGNLAGPWALWRSRRKIEKQRFSMSDFNGIGLDQEISGVEMGPDESDG